MWQPLALELGLCGWIVAVLCGDLLTQAPRHRGAMSGTQSRECSAFHGAQTKRHLWKLVAAGLLAGAGVLWWQQAWIGRAFDAMFILDGTAWYFKGLFLLTALLVVLMTRVFTSTLTERVGEFYLLICSALLGMLVLASVNDLLLLFIGLELLTFSLYVMAAYLKSDARSIEAGLKYLILGSVSSGFLIYGVSLLYGAAGSTNFQQLSAFFATHLSSPLAMTGLVLVLSGLGFKIAAVPFQWWVPDVYEGAPTPVVALLSVGSKAAGIVALLRVLFEAFRPVAAFWGPLLAVLAAVTMLYGNLAAIPQTNIKRLLGYSSIGHAGYLLMGLSCASAAGAQAVGFYVLAYLFSNLAVFFVVLLVAQAPQAAGGDELERYDGLSRRSPLLAAVMFVGLLSLAGVPPLAGFAGKLLVLLAAMDTQRIWLVAIGGLNVAISLYYYLMVVRRMYVRPPADAAPVPVDPLTRAVLIGLLLGILLIGIYQEPVISLLARTIRL